MKGLKHFFSRFYMVLCFVFFYLPILVTVVFSFNSSKSLTNFTGFSMRWYQELLSNSEVMSAVYVSVTVALLSTAISTILGTLTALGLSKSRKFLKEYLLNINNIPILNPEIVSAISLMLLFSSMGLPKGYWTMLLAHISFCTPFVITSVYPKVRSLDPNLANAAMDLGATPFQALIKVIIPIIRPGIFAGALLAFTMSFDDFVISYFVSGNGVKNISIIVYNMTKRINPTINALSTIVIVVIVAILVCVNVIPMIHKKRQAKKAPTANYSSHRKRRYIAAIVACALMVCVVVGISQASKGGRKVLHIYNAGEYINPDLITQFQEEYGCTIMYETFESNEMMYTKLSSGESYDVIIPSDYMIERLIREDYLQPIQWDLIANKDNLMDEVVNKSYDPGNVYSAPYFWGTVGILYNKTIVTEADLQDGWNVLMNEKFKGNLYMYDSERDSFMVALKALGYSMNTHEESEITDAYNWLIRQRDTMEPVYAGDDVIDNMITGNKAMAIVYSGDGAYIMTENEDMGYFTPPEGTNIWYDAMVITKDCREVELAHEFIDFMLRADVALANTEYVGYSSGVTSAFEEMQVSTYEGINAYVPDTENMNNEIFAYQEAELKRIFAELWTKVKAK